MKHTNWCAIAALSAAIAMSSSAARAQFTPEIEKRAAQLMEARAGAKAYDLLLANYEPGRETPQSLFLLGMAAKSAGRYNEAADHFRRVIALQPSAPRAKLELAEVLHLSGNSDAARKLLLDVKATSPPQPVVQNIDRFLAVIDNSSGSNLRVRGSVGWFYDTNVNQATSARTVTMYGLPFTLADAARRRAAHGLQTKAEIDHVARLTGSMSWQTSMTLGWRQNFGEEQFNNYTGNASTGPVWQFNPVLVVSLPAFVSGNKFEHGAAYYATTSGVAPQIRYGLNSTVDLNLVTSVGWKHYHNNGSRDGSVLSISPSFDLKTGSDGKLTLGTSLGREDSGIDVFSNKSVDLNASYVHQITPTIVGMLYASYGWAFYSEQELAYDEKRHDRRAAVGADIVARVDGVGVDVIVSSSYTRNISNLTLYDFDRILTSVTVRKQF